MASSLAGTDLLSGFVLSDTNLFVGRIISYEPAACPALFHPSSCGTDGQEDFSRCAELWV